MKNFKRGVGGPIESDNPIAGSGTPPGKINRDAVRPFLTPSTR